MKTLSGLLCLLLTCSLAHSRPNPSPRPQPRSLASPPPAEDELNFDLLGSKKLSETAKAEEARRQAAIDRQVKIRRFMLVSHQAVGFVLMGVMAATLVVGQLNYQDKYGGGDDNGKLYNWHLGLGVASGALFAVDGTLALFAPNPYPKPIRFDAALLHKVSMALAAAGMVTQLILGPLIGSREGKLDQRSLALTHLVVGYATFGFMATGVIAYLFP